MSKNVLFTPGYQIVCAGECHKNFNALTFRYCKKHITILSPRGSAAHDSHVTSLTNKSHTGESDTVQWMAAFWGLPFQCRKRNSHQSYLNARTLWLCVLSVVSLRQLQACQFFECFNNEHSRCSTLCPGGRWLDLKKANAQATHHEDYMGPPYAAKKAIDGDPNSCAMSRVCDCAIHRLYVQSKSHKPKPNQSPPRENCADQPEMDSGFAKYLPNCCR